LGHPYTATEAILQRSFRTNYNPIPVPRTQAGEGSVLIWRTFDQPLNAQNGFFGIVKESQGMNAAEAAVAETVEVEVRPGQALILDGSMWIAYPQNGGGLGQYKIIRKS
jgi:hypothetical protein